MRFSLGLVDDGAGQWMLHHLHSIQGLEVFARIREAVLLQSIQGAILESLDHVAQELEVRQAQDSVKNLERVPDERKRVDLLDELVALPPALVPAVHRVVDEKTREQAVKDLRHLAGLVWHVLEQTAHIVQRRVLFALGVAQRHVSHTELDRVAGAQKRIAEESLEDLERIREAGAAVRLERVVVEEEHDADAARVGDNALCVDGVGNTDLWAAVIQEALPERSQSEERKMA